MQYYVSHMTPIKRARVHKGSCPDCRDGQGQANQQKDPQSKHTGWSRAFDTLEEAVTHMKSEFPSFTDTDLCGRCKPGVSL